MSQGFALIAFIGEILLMEEILHQLIGSFLPLYIPSGAGFLQSTVVLHFIYLRQMLLVLFLFLIVLPLHR